MTRFHCDYETASETDLSEVGLYAYATHPTTRVLLLGYAFDDNPVKLWEPHKSPLPPEVVEAFLDPFVEKHASNAAVERLITKFVLGIDVPTEEWRDTAVLARYHSLPSNLEDVGIVLGLSDTELKMKDGKELIKLFCMPFRDGGQETLFGLAPAVFMDWETHPREWTRFGEYCVRDVETERIQLHRLNGWGELPDRELRNWWLDQHINDRGIPTDESLIAGASRIVALEQDNLYAELKRLTKLENPNSRDQILGFVQQQGYTFSRLGKAFVARALAGEGSLTPEARKVLELRQQLSKSSVDKFTAFTKMMGVDRRLHHQFVFMGAPRTARWASKGINLQNLLRPTKETELKLEETVELVRAADLNAIREYKGSVFDTVASCLRPVFKAPPGSQFNIADLSAIENVVLGWISDCEKILNVFRTGLDPYKSFGVYMFGKAYDQITKDERNLAKAPTLGCGYRLSAGHKWVNDDGDEVMDGLMAYAAGMGIEMSQEQAERAVSIFRKEFPEVKNLWYALERAWVAAYEGTPTVAGKCLFEYRNKIMYVTLPSGRDLHYINPHVEYDVPKTWIKPDGEIRTYTQNVLSFDGMNAEVHQWGRCETHGGKLVENWCQAIARDVLAEGMQRATKKGFDIVAHVHDEIVAEVSLQSHLTVLDLEQSMADPINWAPGLPLKAVGFSSNIYRKG